MFTSKKITPISFPILLTFFIGSISGFPGVCFCQSNITAIINARIYPASAEVIPSGVMLFQEGKIIAVGPDIAVPEDAQIIDCRGKNIMPGIVETHSHMGTKLLWNPLTRWYNNELSKPMNAEVRVIDGLNTNDRGFPLALSGGITTMCCIDGSQSPNSGQAAILKLKGGTIDDMYLAHGGMKLAIRRTNWEGFPKTKPEISDLLMKEFSDARQYLNDWDQYEAAGRSGPPPSRDLKLEGLGKVLTKEWIVGIHSYNTQDLNIVMNLKKEFGVDIYIIHGQSAGENAEELVKLDIPLCFGPMFPTWAARENPTSLSAVRFSELGGKVSLQQDHPDGNQYYLRHSASSLVRKGMSQEEALKTLTINPAQLLRISERVGSLEPGKDADFLILNGHPLEIETLVEQVFIEGRQVYNRSTGFVVFKHK